MLTLTSKYNLDKVDELLIRLPPGHRDIKTLKHVQKNNVYGTMKDVYNYGSKCKFGRLYAPQSYQSLTKKVRSIVGMEFYHDIDIENCFPTLIYQVFQENRIPCSLLLDYIATRESVFERIILETGLNRDTVKKCFIIVLHCGSYKQATDGQTVQYLEEFSKELREGINQLSHLPQYEDIVQMVKDQNKRNKLGSFISWICQKLEIEVVMCAMEFFTNLGYVIGVYMFDGIMIERKGINELPHDLLSHLSTYVQTRTNRKIVFTEKPLEYEQVDQIFPEMKIDRSRPIVLFEIENILGDYKHGKFVPKPDIQLIQKLRDKYQIGIFTSRTIVRLDEVEHAIGFKFDLVLNSEYCYKPSAEYLFANPHLLKTSKIKNMSWVFGDYVANVHLIDSQAERVHFKERDRVIKFRREPNEIKRIVDLLFNGIPVVTNWPDSVECQIHDETVVRVKPTVFETKQRCKVVGAGMGTGKTHQLRLKIRKSKFRRILIISTRISLGEAQKGWFEDDHFSHYSDEKWTDRLIIQYESLSKLLGNTLHPYELVVLDEVRSLIGNITSLITNKDNIATNFDVLKTLCSHPQTEVIALDADLNVDAAVPTLLLSLFQPHEIHVDIYKYVSLRKSLICTTNQLEFYNRIEDQITNGKRVTVCFQSRKRALIYLTKIKEVLMLQVVVKCYTRFTDDAVIKELCNINIALQDTFLVIMTSKVSSGVDHTNPWDSVHIDAGGVEKGCSARDLLQMVGRFRRCSCNDVYVLIKEGKPEEKYDLYAASLRSFEYQKRFVLKYLRVLKFQLQWQNIDQNQTAVLVPDTITQLFAYQDAERKQNFKFQLQRLCGMKEFDITFPRPSDEAEEADTDFGNAKLLFEQEQDQREINMFNEVKQGMIEYDVLYGIRPGMKYLDQLIVETDQRIKKQTATVEDREKNWAAHVIKHFCQCQHLEEGPSFNLDLVVPMDVTGFKVIKKYFNQIRNICAIHRLTFTQIQKLDYQRHIEMPWVDVNCFLLSANVTHINQCMKLLGVQNVFDFETKIPPDWVVEHEKQLKEHCKQSRLARHARPCRTDNVLGELRDELKKLFGITVSGERTSHKKGSPIDHYHLAWVSADLMQHANMADFYREDVYDPETCSLKRKRVDIEYTGFQNE